jgi:hypothetical protein
MAQETTVKRGFLDNLQQAVGVGTQIAGVMQQGQQIAQKGRELDIMKQEAEDRAKMFKAQQEKITLDMEATRLDMAEKGNQKFTAHLLKASSYATPKERQAYFQNYKDSLMGFQKAMGNPMDEAQLENLIVEQSGLIAQYKGDMQTGLEAMAMALKSPRPDREAFMKGQQLFNSVFDKAVGLAPALSGSYLEKMRDQYINQFEDDKKLVATSAAKGQGLTPAQEAFEKEAGKGAAESAKGGGFSRITLDQLDRGVSLLVDKGLKVGPLAGMAPITELRKLVGDVDLQEFEYITKGAFMAELMKFAKEVGVRGIDTEKEQEAIRQAIVNMKQNPELAIKALLKIKATAMLAQEASEEKQKYISEGGMLSSFQPASMKKSAYVPRTSPGEVLLLTPEEASKRKDLVNITEFTFDKNTTAKPADPQSKRNPFKVQVD